MPSSATVEVVVHLHGHSPQGRRMNPIRDMEPRSGLDLVDPVLPATVGRTTPTLLVLPRGHFYGGGSARGYSLPALVAPGAMSSLVEDALSWSAQTVGKKWLHTQPNGRFDLTGKQDRLLAVIGPRGGGSAADLPCGPFLGGCSR
jgi:hypothetical protein